MAYKLCEHDQDCEGEPLPADLHAVGKNYGNPYAPFRARGPEIQAMMNMLARAHPRTQEAMEAFVVEPPHTPIAVELELARFRLLCTRCAGCPLRKKETG